MDILFFFFFQAEDGIRDFHVTGVQTCALPIWGTRFDLGVVGAGARATAEQVVDAGKAQGFDVTVCDYPSEQQATSAVRSGSADAVLVGGTEVIVNSQPPEQLVAAIQSVSIEVRARQALERSGLPPDRIDEVLNVQPLPVRALEPVDE